MALQSAAVGMHLVKVFVTGLIVVGVLVGIVWQVSVFLVEQSRPHTDVILRGTVFKSRVVHEQAERTKGLSGTKSLGKDDGMLFVFDSDEPWGIWMKDMLIPIDIIWLDANKEVIYIVKEADPSSYPYTTYKPTRPARYVLEVAAGTVDARGIRSGDKASFDLGSIKEESQ